MIKLGLGGGVLVIRIRARGIRVGLGVYVGVDLPGGYKALQFIERAGNNRVHWWGKAGAKRK